MIVRSIYCSELILFPGGPLISALYDTKEPGYNEGAVVFVRSKRSSKLTFWYVFFGRAPDQRCTVPESAWVYWGCQARGCKCVVRWWSPCRRASQGDSYSCVWHNSFIEFVTLVLRSQREGASVLRGGCRPADAPPRWCIFTRVTWHTHGVRDTYIDGARRGGASVLCRGGRPADAPSKEIDIYHVWHFLFLEFVTLILRVLSARVHVFCAMVVAL